MILQRGSLTLRSPLWMQCVNKPTVRRSVSAVDGIYAQRFKLDLYRGRQNKWDTRSEKGEGRGMSVRVWSEITLLAVVGSWTPLFCKTLLFRCSVSFVSTWTYSSNNYWAGRSERQDRKGMFILHRYFTVPNSEQGRLLAAQVRAASYFSGPTTLTYLRQASNINTRTLHHLKRLSVRSYRRLYVPEHMWSSFVRK